MRKLSVIFAILIVVCASSVAQRRNGLIGHRTETAGYLYLNLGPAYCYDDPFGSLFGSNFWNGTNFQISTGFYQPLFINDLNFGYRVMGSYYNFSGKDIPGSKVHHDNLGVVFESYVSNAFELTGRFEYHYAFGRRYHRVIPHELYAFTGMGLMFVSSHFPKEEGYPVYEGKKSLTPIVCLPLGVGYQYNLDRNFSVGVELNAQAAFSDLVDGYEGSHLPGVKIINDNVSTLAFTFLYRLY